MSAGSGTNKTNWSHSLSAKQYSKPSNRNPESDFPNSFSRLFPLRGGAVAFSPLLQTLFFPGKARRTSPRSYCHFFCHANCEYRPPPSSLRSAPSPSLVIFLASALLPFFPARKAGRKSPHNSIKKVVCRLQSYFFLLELLFRLFLLFFPSFAKAGKRNVSQVPQRDSYPLHKKEPR